MYVCVCVCVCVFMYKNLLNSMLDCKGNSNKTEKCKYIHDVNIIWPRTIFDFRSNKVIFYLFVIKNYSICPYKLLLPLKST